jgi:DNA-binding MarR family transcriptional regulator
MTLPELLAARRQGLSIIQLATLMILAEKTRTMGQLSKLLSITPAGMTQVIDGLYALNCLTREYSQEDRRTVTLRIARLGREKLAIVNGCSTPC